MASIAGICGIFCIALPVTILGNNFTKALSAYNEREKRFKILKRNYLVDKLKTKISGLQSLKGISGSKQSERPQLEYNDNGELILSDKQKTDIKSAFEVFDIDQSGWCLIAFCMLFYHLKWWQFFLLRAWC